MPLSVCKAVGKDAAATERVWRLEVKCRMEQNREHGREAYGLSWMNVRYGWMSKLDTATLLHSEWVKCKGDGTQAMTSNTVSMSKRQATR
jgi:hypothetical protein